jgi:CRISPR system Cascade subunit CasA
MTTPEFNLLDEPWIKVIRPDCTEEEVSLTQALLRAHEFKDLCGEMATQDVAVLRLLLAVLHTVWSRVDTDGAKSPLESADDAEERWETLWNLGRFPAQPILDYLARWHERFWLFHDQRPFGQLPKVQGTYFDAKKINAAISESGNTVRLFSERCGTKKNTLSYAEAARWMIHLNVFDDGACKSSPEKDPNRQLPPLKVGYLCDMGVIVAQGKNLFQTLMLNMVLLKNGTEEWPEENCPAWEKDTVNTAERFEVAMPQNQAELLTLPFRRIALERENCGVTGYRLLGGDFFDTTDGFAEQMTVWKRVELKDKSVHFYPKHHEPSKQMWREFSACFGYQPDEKMPGVVNWVYCLLRQKSIPSEVVTFKICALICNWKQATSKPIKDYFFDALTFHAALLTEVGAGWRVRIQEEINRCEQLAWCAGKLEDDLAKASGKDDGSGQKEDVRARMYDRLDLPFRKWLYEIDPKVVGTEMEAHVDSWHDTACKTARQLGYELVSAAGEKAFFGRYLQEKQQGSVHYSSAEAYERFVGTVKKITSREGMKWQKK